MQFLRCLRLPQTQQARQAQEGEGQLPSGNFVVNRAQTQKDKDGNEILASAGEVITQVDVAGAGGVTVDGKNAKLMDSIARFAKGGPNAKGNFIEKYKNLSLRERELIKSKYRGQIEQNVPQAIKQQLNEQIAEIDRKELFEVAAGKNPPVSKELQAKIDNRERLTREDLQELKEAKSAQREARTIVSMKRRAKGLSVGASKLMDDFGYNECFARLVDASGAKGFLQGFTSSRSKEQELQSLELPSEGKRGVRYSGGIIYNEDQRSKKLEQMRAAKKAYIERFKSTVQSSERSKNWFIFDSAQEVGFKENEEYCNLEANKVRKPVIEKIDPEVRENAAKLLGKELPAESIVMEWKTIT